MLWLAESSLCEDSTVSVPAARAGLDQLPLCQANCTTKIPTAKFRGSTDSKYGPGKCIPCLFYSELQVDFEKRDDGTEHQCREQLECNIRSYGQEDLHCIKVETSYEVSGAAPLDPGNC